jgi:D-xylulose reductase
MKALVLEKARRLTLRDIHIEEYVGPDDVCIKIHTVGICGSDVHYYLHGAIGPFVVREPMVLGHEASGIVVEVGEGVRHLKVGDRVCMEPGIPDPNSKASRLGMYNLDPAVRFWATPPVHGCLRETVVHPGMFVFKLPENVSFDEGALVEPFAVGLYAVQKAQVKPGDSAVVIGAGTIGLVTATAAIAAGCSKVIIADIVQEKLDLASRMGMMPVNVTREGLNQIVSRVTNNWGADIVFEVSGSEAAASRVFEPLCPGGRVVFVGMPRHAVPIDIVSAQVKEARIETIFRYAHVYPRALSLMESGKVNLKPLITDRYGFEESVAAFEYAANPKPSSVKIIIEL